MDQFQEKIKGLRKHQINDPRIYVNCWSEKDLLDGKIADAFVIILRTRGCRWALNSGCSMCGYINEAADASDDDVLHQFSEAMNQFEREKIVKIYTSGSFLDPFEISESLQFKILKKLDDKVEKIIVESRPDFIYEKKLGKIKKFAIEIAVGLESWSDLVLKNCVNKGFGVKDFIRVAKILNQNMIPLKTYILIKPPFLTELEAINDAIFTASFAYKYSSTISFNPVNVQSNTLVEFLYKRKEYRPPWLWSIIEVLEKSKALNAQLMCKPAAGGRARGAHNCGKCDSKMLNAIERFSLKNDSSAFKNLSCDCREEWLDILELEEFVGPIL